MSDKKICKDCKYFCSKPDDWYDELIYVWCDLLRVAKTFPMPNGWQEGDKLPKEADSVFLGGIIKHCERNKTK